MGPLPTCILIQCGRTSSVCSSSSWWPVVAARLTARCWRWVAGRPRPATHLATCRLVHVLGEASTDPAADAISQAAQNIC